jgi:hypothetical protein
MFRQGELSNRHKPEQVVPLRGREVQRVGARVEIHGDMLQLRTFEQKRAASNISRATMGRLGIECDAIYGLSPRHREAGEAGSAGQAR